MIETIKYIIQFLLGENISPEIGEMIGYTSNQADFHKYKIAIVPSGFFNDEIYGTLNSLPKLPLKIWEESPLLFGEPQVEKVNNTIVVYADLVASTYFLISRYEEMVRKDTRDEHKRFPGKESLPYRAGFIDRPLVDEYGKILRLLMRENGIKIPEPEKKIKKIYLTHDLDQIAHFRNIRSVIGGLIRGLKRPKEGNNALKSFFGGLRFDPWYTFPFLYNIDNEVVKHVGSVRCEPILFIRAGLSRRKEDRPFSNLIHPDYQHLIKYTKRKGVKIGLHTSYAAGVHPDLVVEEKKRLEHFAKTTTTYNRNHFLNTREPFDMISLINAGIKDDFTLGYADMAGFRLGTCRPVQWINLLTKEVTSLTLHSLAIMDVSLSDKKYMFMNAHDAYQYCEQLINRVESYNGELVLLWHNTWVEKTPQSYHRQLYKDIIKYLLTK
ncbi:MAG: polysaccharide deacetylase family protein [Paludibacter sp.]|nr:polysaccharide deacetylase family protein [Paludibacter sp.]